MLMCIVDVLKVLSIQQRPDKIIFEQLSGTDFLNSQKVWTSPVPGLGEVVWLGVVWGDDGPPGRGPPARRSSAAACGHMIPKLQCCHCPCTHLRTLSSVAQSPSSSSCRSPPGATFPCEAQARRVTVQSVKLISELFAFLMDFRVVMAMFFEITLFLVHPVAFKIDISSQIK